MKYKCPFCKTDLKLSEYEDKKFMFDTETYYMKCSICGEYSEFKDKKDPLETNCSYLYICQSKI